MQNAEEAAARRSNRRALLWAGYAALALIGVLSMNAKPRVERRIERTEAPPRAETLAVQSTVRRAADTAAPHTDEAAGAVGPSQDDDAERPLGWRALPSGIRAEMEERLAELMDLHRRASGLPDIAEREGLAAAGVVMRDVQKRCREASDDYRLRFGSLLPWSTFDTSTPEAEAHRAMAHAFGGVCGLCPTLLGDARDACREARKPLQAAHRALARWAKPKTR